ncbi:MAG TPA: tRNA glutamyl-Q(34) synthetase GluQRS [Rhizomicrobium sp.]|jgi:glutamyl-Q tRNA(Asp) synthetase|nr:tRNA glutamyl-Q(34) synthetase GluQRS [Rhizomicrobium sp.]
MFVTRFAPSPTGYLHLGHAFAAITANEAAGGGRFLLRIEDIDSSRCRETFVEAIFQDLRWLGLSWVEPVLRQSARMEVYGSALDRLTRMGLVYPCFCTRAETAAEIAHAGEAPHGPDGPIYPGTCRQLPVEERLSRTRSGGGYALRLDSARAAARVGQLFFEEAAGHPPTDFERVRVNPVLFGDVVLARKDTPASYHLAVVIDDAAQSITLVTRGRDLLPSTHVQRVLQTLLNLPAPKYAHHRLILDEDGRKLSKREGSAALRNYRNADLRADEIVAMLQRA